MKEAISPKRREETAEMKRLGLKTRKAYKKFLKKERHKKNRGQK